MAFPDWFDDKFGPHTIDLYEEEIARTPEQLAALRKLLGEAGAGIILDLCCGWGRHSLPLARMGYRVAALDGSSYFIRRLHSDMRPEDRGKLFPLRGDMRSLPLAGCTVRAAIQMYTSFGYCTDPADDLLTLREIYRVLAPEGAYLLDLINWTLARQAFDGRYQESYSKFDVVEECRVDPGTNLLHIRRALLFRDGSRLHTYEFEIRMFDQATLAGLLKEAGFEILDFWGGFDRSDYDPANSYRMIALCRKKRSR